MKKILILLAIITLYSCTTEQRFARLISKKPQLILGKDTAYKYDTVYTPEYKRDTLFRTIAGKRDTFIINLPNGGSTTIYTNEDKSELQASTFIPSDTTVNSTMVISQYMDAYEARIKSAIRKYAKIGALSILLLALLAYFFRTFKRDNK